MFFVLSPYPKSGTTLLLESINNHPLTQDRKYIENLFLGRMLDSIGDLAENQKVLYNILEEKDKGWQKVVADMTLSMIEKDGPLTELYGTKFSLYKYPKFLNTIFPTAKIICIRRDPRDSYCSAKAMDKGRGNNNYMKPTLWIRKYFYNFINYKDVENILFIDYENLVTNYNDTMKSVWDFLNVDQHTCDIKTFGSDIFNRFSKQSIKITPSPKTGITNERIGRYASDLLEGEIFEMNRDISMFIEKNPNLPYGDRDWTLLKPELDDDE